MRLLKAADHRRMPWKNGAGETIEIAVHPEGAGLEAFDWRVSLASVAVDGPFSVFPGIDRTLAILEGAAMVLDIEGLGRHRLTPQTAPLAFPADAPTSARLEDGPIADLNVMSRRGVRTHRLERLEDAAPGRIEAEGGWRLVLALGAMVVSNGREELELARYDAALLEGPGTFGLSIPSAAPGGYLVVIE